MARTPVERKILTVMAGRSHWSGAELRKVIAIKTGSFYLALTTPERDGLIVSEW